MSAAQNAISVSEEIIPYQSGNANIQSLSSALDTSTALFNLSIFSRFKQSEPTDQLWNQSIEDVIDLLLSRGKPYETPDKEKAPYFCGELKSAPWVAGTKDRKDKERLADPSVPFEGIQRSKSHVVGASLIKLDLDDVPQEEFEKTIDLLKDYGLLFVCFSTFKHGCVAGLVRARLILFLDRPATVDEFQMASRQLGLMNQGMSYDDSADDPWQLAGCWAAHPSRLDKAFSMRQDGALLSLDKLLALCPKDEPKKDQRWLEGRGTGIDDLTKNLAGYNEQFCISKNRVALRGALEAMNPSHEPDWWHALKCVKGAFSLPEATTEEKGWFYDTVIEWSKGAPQFEDGDQQKAKMDASQPAHPKSLFTYAKKHYEWLNPGPDKVEAALVGTDDPNLAWIVEFNERYTPVLYGTKMTVALKKFDETMNRQRWTFIPFGVFKDLHCAEYGVCGYIPKGEPIIKPKGLGWLTHIDRAPNREFYFDPSKPEGVERDGFLNLWNGLNVSGDPRRGDAAPMIRHLVDCIADGDGERGEYLMGWVAYLLQNPGSRHEVALVLRGKKGSGKGSLGNLLCKIFGKHGLAIRQGRHLTGNFNEHLLDCCFLFADEAFFAGDRAGEAALKGLITEPTLTIEPKGVGVFDVPNRLSVLMATNAEYVVPASADERRYAIFDVSDNFVGDDEYWHELHTIWMNNPDNIAAFIEYMQEYDLSQYSPRRFPETEALKEQRAHSLEPWAEWWRDGLNRGSFFNSDWHEKVGCTALYESFIKYCQDHAINSYGRLTETQLGIKLAKHNLCGPSQPQNIGRDEKVPASYPSGGGFGSFMPSAETGKKVRCRMLGSLEDAQEGFKEAFKVS